VNVVLKLHPNDNVLIALRDLREGEQITFSEQVFVLTSDVPAKHKFATEDLSPGADVHMYGVLVGKAVQPIKKGSALTPRNLRHDALPFQEKSAELTWAPPDVSRWRDRRYLGYHRADGQVGTRNYWLVVPLVFCENRNIEVLKQAFEEELGFARPKIYRQQVAELAKLYREGRLNEIELQPGQSVGRAAANRAIFENVDGIKFLSHQAGCGGTREDGNNLCALIAGYLHRVESRMPEFAGQHFAGANCPARSQLQQTTFGI
jgi:altronate hydrolase